MLVRRERLRLPGSWVNPRSADENGNVTVEPRYRAIACFRNGLAWVPVDASKAWCPIDYAEHIRDDITCTTSKIATSRYGGGRPEQMSDDAYESGVLWMRAEFDYALGVREHPPRIFPRNSF